MGLLYAAKIPFITIKNKKQELKNAVQERFENAKSNLSNLIKEKKLAFKMVTPQE